MQQVKAHLKNINRVISPPLYDCLVTKYGTIIRPQMMILQQNLLFISFPIAHHTPPWLGNFGKMANYRQQLADWSRDKVNKFDWNYQIFDVGRNNGND